MDEKDAIANLKDQRSGEDVAEADDFICWKQRRSSVSARYRRRVSVGEEVKTAKK